MRIGIIWRDEPEGPPRYVVEGFDEPSHRWRELVRGSLSRGAALRYLHKHAIKQAYEANFEIAESVKTMDRAEEILVVLNRVAKKIRGFHESDS